MLIKKKQLIIIFFLLIILSSILGYFVYIVIDYINSTSTVLPSTIPLYLSELSYTSILSADIDFRDKILLIILKTFKNEEEIVRLLKSIFCLLLIIIGIIFNILTSTIANRGKRLRLSSFKPIFMTPLIFFNIFLIVEGVPDIFYFISFSFLNGFSWRIYLIQVETVSTKS